MPNLSMTYADKGIHDKNPVKKKDFHDKSRIIGVGTYTVFK